MKKQLSLILLLCTALSAWSQGFQELQFGTDTTFDVVTWNIEHFPKNGAQTIDYVSQIIEAMDVDVIAIQEVENRTLFDQMVDDLPGYEGFHESSYFAGLAYIYKADVVEIKDIYEIYTSSPYWSPFPRSPVVMELRFRGADFVVINNHFKCCGDGYLDINNSGDEESRRLRASNLLKTYIDDYFPYTSVILTGDLNDEILNEGSNNVFQGFLDDPDNYQFADMGIAEGSNYNWSYPTWPSHLDHMLVTNELFNTYENNPSHINTIKIEELLEDGWSEYDQNVSDHRPVALKIHPILNAGIGDHTQAQMMLSNFPNPIRESTTFSFDALDENAFLEICNLQGQMIETLAIPKGRSKLIWTATGFQDGLYIARLITDSGVFALTNVWVSK